MVRFTVVVLLTALLQSVTAFQPVASFPSTLVQQGDSRTVALPPVSFLSRRRAPEDWLPNRRNSKTRLFVFERMSEDCIAGVVQAQQEAATLQLARVGTVVMMAGCLSQPESNALKRTMRAYAITSREASRTLPAMYKEHARNETLNNNGWLSGFRAAKDDDDRPFSPKLKRTFVMAGRLADQMGSTLIQPNHIFLALLEYEESKEGVKKAAEKCDDLSDINNCGAWGLLKMMNSFDEEVSALTICQSLIDNMVNEETDEKELVTGVGPVSKTPTLEECGTDLTELARDGLLDPVFGRDQEIRSCMRTLIRRRKNNVCLTGEPGVGKVCRALLVSGSVIPCCGDTTNRLTPPFASLLFVCRRPLPKASPRS
jgi:ATP-dependent Clp protease ATP-binding subunit ClpA